MKRINTLIHVIFEYSIIKQMFRNPIITQYKYQSLFKRMYLFVSIWHNKRPTGLNGHLSIRDFTLTSCQKSLYLHINIKNNYGIEKQHHNHLTQ